MKNALCGLLFLIVATACDTYSNADTSLEGTWKLTAMLADPGDGSGTFRNVVSDKTITFFTDGTLTSNGEICDFSIEAINPSTGTYSFSDSRISSANCNNASFGYTYVQTGNVLVISYPCIEACQARFRKL